MKKLALLFLVGTLAACGQVINIEPKPPEHQLDFTANGEPVHIVGCGSGCYLGYRIEVDLPDASVEDFTLRPKHLHGDLTPHDLPDHEYFPNGPHISECDSAGCVLYFDLGFFLNDGNFYPAKLTYGAQVTWVNEVVPD